MASFDLKMSCTHMSVHTKLEKVLRVETKLSLVGASRASWPGPWTTNTTLLSVVWCGHKLNCVVTNTTLKAADCKNRKLKAVDFLNFVSMSQSWTHFTSWSADKICIGQRGHTTPTGCCWICCLSYPGRRSHITTAWILPRKARPFTLTRPNMECGSVGAGIKPCL